MSTDIATIPTSQLRKALGFVIRAQDEDNRSFESEELRVSIGDLALSSDQIMWELDIRKACRDKRYRDFQWDVHHLAEDCIQTLGPEDEDAIDKLTKGIAEFRAKFNIKACPSCRQ